MHILTDHSRHEHFLTKVDARVKLIASLLLLVMVLSNQGMAFPAFVTALCVLLCATMHIPLRTLAFRFSEPLFIAAVLLVLKVFFSGGAALFSLKVFGLEITGHRDGLMEGLHICSRIIGGVSIVAVLGFSTPFNEFIAGLSWFRVPKGFTEILMFAYRSVFVLFEDAMVIYTAQKNRLGYSTIKRGLSSFGVLAGSLTLKAFENSQNTTTAMVQRGYDGTMPAIVHRPFKYSEVALSFLFVAAAGLLWRM